MHLDIESVCVLYAGGIVERTVLATRMVRSHSLPHSLFRSLISHFKLNEYFRPLCSILLIVLDIFSSLLSFSSPSSLRSQVQALNFKHLRLKGKCWCDRSSRIFVKIQTNRYCSHRKMYILRHTAAGTHECSEQEHGTSTHNTFIPWRKSITLRTSSVMLWYFNGVDSLCTHQQKNGYFSSFCQRLPLTPIERVRMRRRQRRQQQNSTIFQMALCERRTWKHKFYSENVLRFFLIYIYS